MKPIFLIGYMGSGKTTLGRALAKATGLGFIDLDLRIESRFRRSVGQLFAELGEAGFRALERDMLAEVADFSDVIVACGGGTPCFHDNMDLMNAAGLTVRLVASEPVLLRRLMAGQAKRPLLAGKSPDELRRFIAASLAEREPHYSRARASFGSDRLESKEQVADSVSRFASTFNLTL